MVKFALEFYGDVQLSREIARIAERPKDARPVWQFLADRFAVYERGQFSSHGRYGSGGWAPLSPGYAAWKHKHYPGKPILVRTGTLKASLTARPFGVDVIENAFMAVGSDVSYGRYHQQGTPHMPRRRPVELSEAERRRWIRTLQRYLITGGVALG